MNSEIFEKLPPTKLLLRCGIPAMVTMAFGALYQIADGLFVGRFIGGDALAAVNLIMPVIMMAFALSDMVAAGASVRISIFLGEKKREEASRVFSTAIKSITIYLFSHKLTNQKWLVSSFLSKIAFLLLRLTRESIIMPHELPLHCCFA